MENHCVSVNTSAPLFITEGDDEPTEAAGGNLLLSPAQSDHTFMGVNLCQTLSIGPYLKEMDDLLKNCEELTGISENTCTETRVCSQEYMSTSCIDAKEIQLQDTGFDKCGAETCVSSAMPLTSAGTKLSESMAEYEGQLMDMLAKLESCDSNMDYRPQDWSPNEEYVHIPKLFKETGKTSLESNKSMILEAHAAAINFCDNQDSTNEIHSRKRAAKALTHNVYANDNVKSLTVQSSDECSKDHSSEDALNPSLCTKPKQIMCEVTHNEDECKFKDAGNSVLNEATIDMERLNAGVSELHSLGPKLDEFINEVQSLVQKRRQLQNEVMKLSGHSQQEQTTETNEEDKEGEDKVTELILILKEAEQLQREKSKREIENLRHERIEEERKLCRVNVERQVLHNEHWRVKRELFVVAKECAQNQAALRSQQQHVDLLKKKEENLKTAEDQLREDRNKLKLEHQQQLLNLQETLDLVTSSHLSNTQEEMNRSRRDSYGDVQQYLQDSLKALEERYGPVLVALLKRRDSAVDAMAKVKEQTQEQRVQLTPLREEKQKLMLQKVCLEEKLRLMSFQKKEEIGQYKEVVNSLEESCRELKMELRLQNTKNNEMKELKERLNKQLATYRSVIEDHVTSNKETTNIHP